MTMSERTIGKLMTDLMAWYKAECNGDWEHTYGIQIETLDNPGWMVTIDLAETDWEGLFVALVRTGETESEWHQYEVNNGKFIGASSTENLSLIIESFFEVIGGNRPLERPPGALIA